MKPLTTTATRIFFRESRLEMAVIWTLAGAVFGTAFGALAAVFQGGPGVVQGIQETWWWFAVAGCLTGLVGSKPAIEEPVKPVA